MRSAYRSALVLTSALAACLWLAPAVDAQAPSSHTKEPFTQARFDELQAQNALILVDIFASWCPDCAMQQRVLNEYREGHPGVPLHTLVVDFDTQKNFVTYFRAPRQSTLVLYRGTERLWFSVAETRAEVIVPALNAAAAGR